MEQNKMQKILSERNLSQIELVKMINSEYPDLPITAYTLNRFVNGVCMNVSYSTILRISNTLGVTPNDILEY